MARKWAVEAKNLKEMKLRFRDIGKVIDGERLTMFQAVAKGVTEAYKTAATAVRDRARYNAQAKGVPRRLYSGARPAIFSFAEFDASYDKKRNRSALVGVRTGAPPRRDDRLYVEWGNQTARKGMSLARIFESGTRKGIRPTRFFRSAIFATRGKVIAILTTAYRGAIDKINRAK
jgi:hypothetical protein